MAHEIIIIMPDDPGLAAPASRAEGSVKFTPSHDLTPEQQLRRTHRAERMLDKIRRMLEAPADAAESDE